MLQFYDSSTSRMLIILSYKSASVSIDPRGGMRPIEDSVDGGGKASAGFHQLLLDDRNVRLIVLLTEDHGG